MALLVMADAINRAKSTDGEKIREALVATDIPGEQTIMPWKRVKFDEMGQNNDADPVLLQYIGGKFVTISPPQGRGCRGRLADEIGRRFLERHHKRSVVPAKAGTHTPRSISFHRGLTSFLYMRLRWLWVPAFAGTTLRWGYPGDSRNHYPKPGERPP